MGRPMLDIDRQPVSIRSAPNRISRASTGQAVSAAEPDTQHLLNIGSLDLESGTRLASVDIAYRTWGRLDARGDNAVLVLHALTGDSRAAGAGGWWDGMIGPGRAIDTDRYFVVSSNVVGGCTGSTGPASIDPLTGRQYAMRFPVVTIGDMVNAQRRLVEALGITRLIAIGGSIGGFQALEWATRHPDLVGATVAIAASGRLSGFGIATHSEVGRRAIMADPDWRGGDYASHGVEPAKGLAIARMAAMITYQGREGVNNRFGRRPASRPSRYESFVGRYEVESYLHHHGDALVRRFDANSYLYLTRAMDLYDVGRGQGEAYWLSRLAAPLLLVGIRSDWLFPPDEIRDLARAADQVSSCVTYAELDSPHGHDAFLKDRDSLTNILRPLLDRLPTRSFEFEGDHDTGRPALAAQERRRMAYHIPVH